MTDAVRYTKAFAKALAEHLRGKVPEFTDQRTGSGGCETCGYGASEYDVLNMERLEAAIDEFAAEFEKKA
jgi:hypothetical protein